MGRFSDGITTEPAFAYDGFIEQPTSTTTDLRFQLNLNVSKLRG